MKNALGFIPNIRNIFKMLFAHLDCFMNHFYATMKNIQKSAENGNRKSEAIGWSVDNTDIKTGVNSNCDFPPFTGYFIKKDGNFERALPDKQIEELIFVDEMLAALYGLQDKVEEFEENENFTSDESFTSDNYEIEHYDESFNPTNVCDLYVYHNPYRGFEVSSDLKESLRER